MGDARARSRQHPGVTFQDTDAPVDRLRVGRLRSQPVSPGDFAPWLPLFPVACACFVGGWLGQQLVFPSTDVSLIWFPSGIALAALWIQSRGALLGVWLGCLGAWLATLAVAEPPLLPQELYAAAGLLAVTTPLGALMAGRLARRLQRDPSASGELLALVIAALVGCTVEASCRTGVLGLAERIPADGGLRFFAHAWLGSVAGVLFVTPLALTARSGARVFRGHVALSAGVAVSLALFHTLRVHEDEIAAATVERAIDERALAIQRGFAVVIQAADSLAAFIAASGTVDPARFQAFTAHLEHRMPAIRALEWAPREGDRFPVRLAAPAERATVRLGFDLTSEPLRAATLERALAAQDLAVSAPHEEGDGWSMIVMMPVYPGAADPFASAADLEPLGVVGVSVRVDELVEQAIATLEPEGIDLLVLDDPDPGENIVVHAHAAPTRGRALDAEDVRRIRGAPPGIAVQAALPLGDRMAIIRSTPTPEARAALRTWIPLAALGAGWIISALLSSWLLSGAERTRRVEALVFERTRELADANRAKSAFLANMSHEVRTPMTAILGFADALAERGGSDAERLEIVDTIRRNGRHLLAIVDDVLDISKIESGRLEVEHVPCSLVGLVEETAALLRVRAQQKGISLSVDWRFPLAAQVRTDPVRVRQILTNLVGNSVKFTDSGGVRVTVWMSGIDGSTPRVHVEVADDGIGIRHEAIGRLFEPFVQADSSTTRRFGGTGLGLAISRRLAELLGGGIEAESMPGRGSRFRVTLDPGRLDDADWLYELPARRSAPEPRAPEGERTPLAGRVLLAEDTRDTRVLLQHLLSRVGLAVEFAEHGREALEKALAADASGEPFDVILMDMQMPVMDGYEATRALRASGYERPILALTAHAMAGEREKCLAAGCDDYATKPIDRVRLLALVRGHLAKPV